MQQNKSLPIAVIMKGKKRFYYKGKFFRPFSYKLITLETRPAKQYFKEAIVTGSLALIINLMNPEYSGLTIKPDIFLLTQWLGLILWLAFILSAIGAVGKKVKEEIKKEKVF